MSANHTQSLRWYTLFSQPHQKLRRVLEEGGGNSALGIALVCGIAICLQWSDLLNLGHAYATGKIVGFSFILGPILGIGFLFTVSVVMNGLGNLLDKQHNPKFEWKDTLPPLPLRRMVLWRLIPMEKELAFWKKPAVSWIQKSWSGAVSSLHFVVAQVSQGEFSLGKIQAGLSWAFLPMGWCFAPIFLGLMYLDGLQFSSTDSLPSLAWAVSLYGLMGVCHLATLGLSFILVKEAFKLNTLKSLIVWAISIFGSLGIWLFMAVIIFNIRLW